MIDARVSVFCDIACHLGEGPTYDPDSDTLFWFDIVERRLLEKQVTNGQTRIHELPVMASALAFTQDGDQVLATETGLQLREPKSGSLSMIAPIEADNPDTRSNDARVHPCGAFWIGTMDKQAERKAGAIYWHRKGETRLLYPDISIPNSICFSPDGSVAYFTDTLKGILFRVACDPQTGLPAGDPAVFVDRRGMEGGIDGSVTDADGNLWNARWGGAALDCYTPDAVLLDTVKLPARQTSCPAFVGIRAERIAVTSAFEGLDETARGSDPDAGRTFIVDLPVRGRFESRLAL